MTSRRFQELSDEELDVYVVARLQAVGVDLSVLPEDEEDAPADRRRILSSARRFLRSTPAALLDFEPPPDEAAPDLYPAALAARLTAQD